MFFWNLNKNVKYVFSNTAHAPALLSTVHIHSHLFYLSLAYKNNEIKCVVVRYFSVFFFVKSATCRIGGSAVVNRAEHKVVVRRGWNITRSTDVSAVANVNYRWSDFSRRFLSFVLFVVYICDAQDYPLQAQWRNQTSALNGPLRLPLFPFPTPLAPFFSFYTH